MRILRTMQEMREARSAAARAGLKVGFVPTMGYLHAGHLSLVEVARARADRVVLSVFVNPLQFGPGEDFARYPRDLARDESLAAAAGVDLLFAPPAEDLYPEPPLVTVAPGPPGEVLEGFHRPGHFAGVLTVVLKLFQVVSPGLAVFGRKDVQQAALVRRMVRDFNLPVEIVVAPTVRESDGLALSSRNTYLDAAARSSALSLVRSLAVAVDLYREGERRSPALVAAAARVLEAAPALAVDYVSCVDPDSFTPLESARDDAVLAVAARVGGVGGVGGAGGTRLIDNVILGEGLDRDARVAA